MQGLTIFEEVVILLDYKCQMTIKFHNYGRVIGVCLVKAQTGCLSCSVTPFRSLVRSDTGREVASAARFILSVSHQQIFTACLPNTVTAAETEAISLARCKCKWTPFTTTENGGTGGGEGGIYQLVCGRKVSQKIQRAQNVRRCKSEHFVIVRTVPGGLSTLSPLQTYVWSFPMNLFPPSKGTFENTSRYSKLAYS